MDTPATKTVRSYLGTLGNVAWNRHRWGLLMTFGVPALIDCTQILAQLHLGLLSSGRAWPLILAIMESYVPYFGASLVFLFGYTSWLIWKEQQTSIETKQQLIDCDRAERDATAQQLRANADRRVAVIESKLSEATATIAALRRDEEPDVMLEYSSPGPFVLRNYGSAASKISVKLETAARGHVTGGPDWYAIDFRIVPDLHAGQPIPIDPDVTPTTWARIFGEKDDPGLINILGVLARLMARDIQDKQHPGQSSSSTTDIILAAMEPIRFPMSVTYSDRNGTGEWVRNETLVYEPKTRWAYIEHGTRTGGVATIKASQESAHPA